MIFGIDNAEIKKMTKYQDLKNEIKRSWLKSVKIAPPVIIGATGIIKKNLTEILKPSLGILPQTNYNWWQSGVR